MVIRFFAVLLLLLAVETVAFLHAHQDLIALRNDPDAVVREGAAHARALARRTFTRRRLTRQHLERLASVANHHHLVDVEVRSLERLRVSYPHDPYTALRLADAYRRAQQFDAATALYRELLEQAGK